MGEYSVDRVLKMQPRFLPSERFWDYGQDFFYDFLFRC